MVKIITTDYYLTCIGADGKRHYFHEMEQGSGEHMVMLPGKKDAIKFTREGANEIFEWCKTHYPDQTMEIVDQFTFRILI